MKVRALRSFGGAMNMSRGQEADIKDMFIVDDLLKAGYVEAIENGEPDQNEPEKEEKPKKKGKKRQ